MIELSNIRKSLGNKLVLEDVSLRIKENETVCIIGPTGCGKSTLLRCIAGLEKYDSGTIAYRLSGRQHIGMVSQTISLFSHLNVLHNLTLAPMQVLGMSAEEAELLAMEQLKAVGLSEKANQFPCDLSIGQQQRVAVARSLAMKPAVLLLDEPLSSLDPIASAEVLDVLRKLKREVTMVMITHNIIAAEEIADKIIYIHDGRVIEEGEPRKLLHNPDMEQTKDFISHLKSLNYDIFSNDFDHPELNARIENYCNRFGLGAQAFRFVQLAVEELLNVIPLERGVHLVLSKHDDEVRMSLDVSYESDDLNHIVIECDDYIDDLSISILQGLTDVRKEWNEAGMHYIHLELGQDRLLLK